jgi:4-hydroxybenzoate polyprenyltransferase
VASGQYSRLLAGRYAATSEFAAAVFLTRDLVWGYLLGRKDAGLDLVQIAGHLGVFLFGSTILHSAICVINDILDKELDGQVGAHRHRLCIPNGQLTSS